jgi:hypothetical protein
MGFTCQITAATGATDDLCDSNADCKSGFCDTPPGGHCAPPCCGSTACPTTRAVCNFEPASADEHVRVCADYGHGTKAVGDACTDYSDCLGGRCYQMSDGQKHCSDVCCVDADCGNPSYACHLYYSGSSPLLRCMLK